MNTAIERPIPCGYCELFPRLAGRRSRVASAFNKEDYCNRWQQTFSIKHMSNIQMWEAIDFSFITSNVIYLCVCVMCLLTYNDGAN